MYTYTATIDRNVGEVPMSDLDWSEFIGGVTAIMRPAFHEKQIRCIETHYGTSVWRGVREDSAKITFVVKSKLPEMTDSAKDLLAVRNGLRTLAKMYGQDAIALSIGECELVEP